LLFPSPEGFDVSICAHPLFCVRVFLIAVG
jgi:hypothetical protein